MSNSKTFNKYQKEIGLASRELFAQFLIRIYKEIPTCKIANFSTLKSLQSSNFSDFRKVFLAKLEKVFIVPASTFDNVKGKFPIGFFIWNCLINEEFKNIKTNVFDEKGEHICFKNIHTTYKGKLIIDWLRNFYDKKHERISYLRMLGTDMQHNKDIFFTNRPTENDLLKKLTTNITKNNVVEMSIYLTMRHFTEATWLNDRDQFIYPNDGWQEDLEFQNDCLAFALFHSQNKISSNAGTNHWIPFTEQEVNAKTKFASNFMTQFIAGKIKPEPKTDDLFAQSHGELVIARDEANSGNLSKPLLFSEKATAVFDAGRALWAYYHKQPVIAGHEAISSYNANASLYDIREHFQGRNEKGKMNNKSQDQTYMKLITGLRSSLKILAKKIEPKVYEYGFLKE